MLRDARIRSLALQVLLVVGVLVVAAIIGASTATNLRARGIPLGFDFLTRPAGFMISETILAYRPNDPTWWAIVVGIVNTLFLSVIVLVVSSVLGLIVGIGRLSSNPLVSGTCRVWVEFARNTPALILLIFLYSVWWLILPQVHQAATLGPGVHLSLRGLVMPRVSFGLPWQAWLTIPAAVGLLFLAYRRADSHQARTGVRPHTVPATGLALIALLTVAIWLSDLSPEVEWPRMGRANFEGGIELTPELTTILLGLVIYTTGFIAEIIRSGILAVGKGQWEAASSIGLNRGRTLRLVIIPQALRVILPPLTSQYINVVKNSTLAIAVGYQDFMTIMGTIINKSSHAIEGVVIILSVFLILNLMLSAILNWFNRRMAIVER